MSSEGALAANAATSAELRATDIGVTVMAVSFVALRFLARKQRGVGTWWDDYLILIALVSEDCFLSLRDVVDD